MNALNSSYPLSIQRLAHRFGVEDMLYERKDTTFMASLLYFFGVLTLSGRTELGELILKIPNLVIKKLYAESIQKTLLPDINHDEILHTTREFYSTGNMQPLCEFIEQRFSVFDNRDYRCSNELTVKTAFLVMLFNDIFYINFIFCHFFYHIFKCIPFPEFFCIFLSFNYFIDIINRGIKYV